MCMQNISIKIIQQNYTDYVWYIIRIKLRRSKISEAHVFLLSLRFLVMKLIDLSRIIVAFLSTFFPVLILPRLFVSMSAGCLSVGTFSNFNSHLSHKSPR